MGKIVGVLCIPLIVVMLLIGMVMSGTAGACGSGTGAAVQPEAAAGTEIDGTTPDQRTNAAYIINAAAAMGLSQKAQIIGVMTALGESSLTNLGYGDEGQGVTNPDGSATCSVGLFQQQWCLPGQPWGSREDAMTPQIAATAFFTRLAALPDWESMAPSAAAHRVQGNADPDHYTPSVPLATTIVNALTGSGGAAGGSCSVPADQQALAQELVKAIDEGRLKGSVPDHMQEIIDIANGSPRPDCGVDTRILQVIVIAVRTFDSVGVSDINRKCTNQIEGAGTASSHYIDGGGHAVDFYLFNGHSLTGADEDSLKLITILDPIMPAGSGLGQSNARAAAGVQIPLAHFTEFVDSPTHLHIDVGHAEGPITQELP